MEQSGKGLDLIFPIHVVRFSHWQLNFRMGSRNKKTLTLSLYFQLKFPLFFPVPSQYQAVPALICIIPLSWNNKMKTTYNTAACSLTRWWSLRRFLCTPNDSSHKVNISNCQVILKLKYSTTPTRLVVSTRTSCFKARWSAG